MICELNVEGRYSFDCFCNGCYSYRCVREPKSIKLPESPQYDLQGNKLMDGQQPNTGKKKDEGKPRFELLPYEVLQSVATILTSGANKYDSRNWEKGIQYGRIFGAAQRHLAKFWNQYLDGSNGINLEDGSSSHLDHAITELMFLSAYEKRGMKQFDDRPGVKP